jgi:hypothetical protein
MVGEFLEMRKEIEGIKKKDEVLTVAEIRRYKRELFPIHQRLYFGLIIVMESLQQGTAHV